MESLVLDVRLALRRMAKSPAFTALALLTLATGIGANVAIFGVVDAVLLRPLPFEAPERLAMITREGDVSVLDGADWRAESKSFASIALFLRDWSLDLTGDGEPVRLRGSVAEPEYFDVLGTRPLLGRVYRADENRVGAAPVAVLSEGLWRRRFGAEPGVLGREIVLSDVKATVIGVMPKEFDAFGDGIELWVPVSAFTAWALPERGTNNFDAIGRLREDAGWDAARAELRAISTRFSEVYPRTNRGKVVEPMPLHQFLVGDIRRSLSVLLAAVGLLLFVGGLNLAALLLARGAARQQELAVRVSLGAGPVRLLRQLVVEGLVLSLAGGAAGVFAALLVKDALLAAVPAELPRLDTVALDARVLGFGLAATLLAGLAVSLVPALHALRHDPAGQMHGGAKGSVAGASRQRWLHALVVGEVAVAFLLLAGSGLLLRTFAKLQAVPLGFSPQGVLLADLVLPESRYASRGPQTRAFGAILERMREIPGVVSVGYTTTPPLEPRGGLGGSFLIAGRDFPRNQEPGARVRNVQGDSFRALGMRLREGRLFGAEDRPDGPRVAIVNETLVQRYFGGHSPVGRRIAWRDWDKDASGGPVWMTIVGVVGDLKTATLDQPDVRTIYVPYDQRQVDWQRWGTLAMRVEGDPATYARALHQAIWAVDPTLAPVNVQPLSRKLSSSLGRQRFTAVATGGFAAVALLLALQGVYGLLAFVVEQRRREIGVRMALGARAEDVLRMVLRHGVRLAFAGLAFGLAAAAAGARALESLLFGVAPFDPLTYAGATVVLLAAAALACLLPARRAARVDPIEALRAE
ncbi:MAG: ABC transporter permease [Vicinamibacteria bacterium]